MAPPEFSLFIPQMRMPFPTIIERCKAAEDAGFDGVALMDHLVPPGVPHTDVYDCFVTAAAIASHTQRVRITPLVACAPFRHPAVLAKMAVSLDHLSGGRFELGIGWGSVADELHQFGTGDEPPPARSAQLDEQLHIITSLLRGDEFDFDGTYYRLRAARQRPLPLSHIPILIGGAGPRLTMPLVARYADWWNLPAYAVEQLSDLRPLAGSARISTQHVVGLAPTEADLPHVRATTERRYTNWGSLMVGTAPMITDALVETARRGVERFFLHFSDFAPTSTLARFGSEVIPAVREALTP